MSVESGMETTTTATEGLEQQVSTGGTDNESSSETASSSGEDKPTTFKGMLDRAAKKGATGVDKAPTEGTAQPNPYQPNYKFKVKDKDYEFEDWAKAVIKDKETEEKVRDFHAKAYGLEAVKASRDAIAAEYEELKSSKYETDTALQQLGTFKANKDWDSFFDALDIPKQDILKYAVELVQRDQWTPEQKAQWQQSRQAQQIAIQAQNERSAVEQQLNELRVQQRSFELDQTLSQSQIAEIAQAYDTRTANPGAFRSLVIEYGQAQAARGIDVSAKDAVAEVSRRVSALLGDMQAQQATNVPKVVQPHQKPVIPNIAGRGTSPIKSVPKSFADLKQRRLELEAQGQ